MKIFDNIIERLIKILKTTPQFLSENISCFFPIKPHFFSLIQRRKKIEKILFQVRRPRDFLGISTRVLGRFFSQLVLITFGFNLNWIYIYKSLIIFLIALPKTFDVLVEFVMKFPSNKKILYGALSNLWITSNMQDHFFSKSKSAIFFMLGTAYAHPR